MPLSDDAERFLKLKAPSAKATIALTGFEGEEAMSQPFRFVLDMVADDPSLDMLKMVGQRRNLLSYLRDVEVERYRAIVAKLGLRK